MSAVFHILLFLLALLGVSGAAIGAPTATSPDDLAEPGIESVGVGLLPRGVVSTLAIDRAGFMWVGSGDGLVRYDAHKFRPQGRTGKDVLTQNLGLVRALLATLDGRLWIGTESDGLAVYDPQREVVELKPLIAPGSGPVPTVRSLAEDRNGAVWVGTMGHGLMRLAPQDNSVTRHLHSEAPGTLADDRVTALLVDHLGQLWVGSWRGLDRLRPGAESFEHLPILAHVDADHPVDEVVTSLFEASDGRLWIGTLGGHLAVHDPRTGHTVHLDDTDGAAAPPRGAVTSIIEAPGGVVWIGCATGLELRDLRDGHLRRRLQHQAGAIGGLAGNDVRSLLVDPAGWIWIAGFGVGLQRHNPNNEAIQVLRRVPRAGGSLELTDLRSIMALPQGEVWISTVAAGVVVLDAQLHVIDVLRPPVQAPAGSSAGAGADRQAPAATGQARARTPPAPSAAAQVDAMVRAADGTLWLGTASTLHQFAPTRRWLRSLQHGAGATNRLLADAQGDLWAATQDGLFRLRAGAQQLERVWLADYRALGGDVFALAQAPDGDIWVGSETGLYRVPHGARELVPVHAAAGGALGNAAVISLLFDRQQVLWLDTAVAGLHRMTTWDGQLAHFERITERHGAAGRPFGSNLLQDSRGRLWTHQFIYDPEADRLTTLTVADGVDFGTGWYRAYAGMADGRFLFGGTRGLLVVTPERYHRPSYVPPLVVTELRINGQRVPAGQLGRGLTLAPDQHGFSIEFATLDYSDTDHRRYAYLLQGEDDTWLDTTADFRVATYGRPSIGQHLLQVRASNRDGTWSPRELAIELTVQPAWWQVRWFRIALLLLLGASIYALVQLRTRWLRLRHQQLELKVHQRTAELEAMSQVLQRKSAELEAASLTDPLTGLRNRRFLVEQVERELAQSARRHQDHLRHSLPLGDRSDLIVFLIDIDHFKYVNDDHGHAAGDAVLVQMCARLRLVFRDSDYLVRWGGEEFLIVALGTSRTHAAELAERARAVVAAEPFQLDGGTAVHKTCSIGFVCYPPVPALPRLFDWNTVVNIADAALYAVKASGRDGWLGVLQAQGDSPEELRSWSRGPLHAWQAAGGLRMAASNGVKAGWLDSARTPPPGPPQPASLPDTTANRLSD